MICLVPKRVFCIASSSADNLLALSAFYHGDREEAQRPQRVLSRYHSPGEAPLSGKTCTPYINLGDAPLSFHNELMRADIPYVKELIISYLQLFLQKNKG